MDSYSAAVSSKVFHPVFSVGKLVAVESNDVDSVGNEDRHHVSLFVSEVEVLISEQVYFSMGKNYDVHVLFVTTVEAIVISSTEEEVTERITVSSVITEAVLSLVVITVSEVAD